MFHKPGNLQPKGGWIDYWMAVMLSREELVFWRERPIDGADVEITPVRSRVEVRIFRNIRERHDRLAFCKRRQCPFWYPEDTERCQCQASSKNFPARWMRHIRLSFLWKWILIMKKGTLATKGSSPFMFGIFPLQLGFDPRVMLAPEIREILRNLDRPHARRQDMNTQGHS